MLLAAGAFVLLIACANVAHMVLARTSDREKEIALRNALGAGRGRVIRQFLTENLLLALLGSAAGLMLAIAGAKALVALSPAYIPRVDTVTIDVGVVAFLVVITALTALLFGLAPALRAVGANLSGTLKESSRGGGDGIRRNALRSFLVVSEFALAFVLLMGAGLMIRSFVALESLDAGFNPHNVLSMIVSVAGSREEGSVQRTAFYRQLLERVRALPGVVSAGGINHLPLAGDFWGWPFTIEGRPTPRPGEFPTAAYRIALPGYFETMRLPIVQGRGIMASDDSGNGVVVINERAARDFWPGDTVIGKYITMLSGEPPFPTIVGISKDAKQIDWGDTTLPRIYLAALQNKDFLGGGSSSHIDFIDFLLARIRGHLLLSPMP